MAEWNDGASTDSGRSLGQQSTSGAQDDPAAIRAGINETRERLSDTLSELGERLNPHVVKEQVTERVKEGIREATIGRVEHMARNAANTVSATRSSITDTIRDNPVPAAMVAIGLGWMLFNGRRSPSNAAPLYTTADFRTPAYGDYDESTIGAEGYASGGYDYESDYADTGDESGRAARMAGGVRDKARDVAGSVRSRASHLADRTRDAASSVRETVSTRTHDLAEGVSERARGVASSVSTRTAQGKRRVEDAFQENPLAIGAVTVALGVLAGLAAPRTEREVQLFGDARERVADRAREVVDEVKGRAREAAGEVKDRAQEVASHVMDEAKQVAKDAGATLKGSGGSGATGGSTGGSTNTTTDMYSSGSVL